MLPCKQGERTAVPVPKVETLNACMSTCHDNSECKGFDWLPSAHKCWTMKVRVLTQRNGKEPRHFTQVQDAGVGRCALSLS